MKLAALISTTSFTPHSARAHIRCGHHIGRYNLIKCTNPLHRYHKRPISPTTEPDLHYLVLAAKYWAQTLDTFDAQTGINVDCQSAYDVLISAISAEDTQEAEGA